MSYYNYRTYSRATLDKVLVLWATGLAFDKAYSKVGVSHSPAELHSQAFAWYVTGCPPIGVGDWALTGALAAYLHDMCGWSWGDVMVATDSSQGAVRKAYRDYTGTDDRGLRTGKGGRYYRDDPDLYKDNLRRTGTKVKVGTDMASRKAAALQQRYMAMGVGDLRQLCDKHQLTYGPKSTKAQLVKLLVNNNS